jgi:hypothetical protein
MKKKFSDYSKIYLQTENPSLSKSRQTEIFNKDRQLPRFDGLGLLDSGKNSTSNGTFPTHSLGLINK